MFWRMILGGPILDLLSVLCDVFGSRQIVGITATAVSFVLLNIHKTPDANPLTKNRNLSFQVISIQFLCILYNISLHTSIYIYIYYIHIIYILHLFISICHWLVAIQKIPLRFSTTIFWGPNLEQSWDEDAGQVRLVVAEPVKKGEELFTHYVPWQDFVIDGWCGDVAGGGDCFVSF